MEVCDSKSMSILARFSKRVSVRNAADGFFPSAVSYVYGEGGPGLNVGKRQTDGKHQQKGHHTVALLLNEIKRKALLGQGNHVLHPKAAPGESEDENIF